MSRIMIAAVIALVVCTACVYTPRTGQVETRTMATEGVSRVEFEGIGDLEIAQGDEELITVEADAAVMRYITTQVRGDTLIIGVERGFWRSGLISHPVHYRLTVRSLERVAMLGAGNVHVGAVETDQLALELTGTGAMTVDALAAEEVALQHRGAGTVTLGGQVDAQEAMIAGTGNYQAGDLASRTARIQIAGAGDATVWATEHLTARIAGVGSIRYYGDPLLDQRITGVGQVTSLGNH